MQNIAVIGSLFAALLFVSLAWGSEASAGSIAGGTDPKYQGDADCSGAVSPVDSLRILRDDAGLSPAPCPEAADTNCDGEINPVDSLRVLRFDAGLPLAAIEGCASIGEPLSDPTSEELIDAALAQGEIDDGTAILYKAYAAFADPRLPAEYKGAPADGIEPPHEIWYRPEGLDPAIEEALDAFLLPPPAPGSWYNQQQAAAGLETPPPGDWDAFVSPSGDVAVWYDFAKYPEDESRAEDIAAVVDEVWGKAFNLLLREPLSDAGLPNNGLFGSHDIYLAPLEDGLLGYDSPYQKLTGHETPCLPQPTFTVISRELSDIGLASTLAHELFHSFQQSFESASSCFDGLWFREATATWFEDFATTTNVYQRWTSFFQVPEAGMPWGDGYDAYLFFLFLTRTGDQFLITDMFDAAEVLPIYDAIDEVIEGGFSKALPEFALAAANLPPERQLLEWDGLEVTPFMYRQDLDFDNPKGQATLGGSGYEDLSVNYFSFGIDAEVGSVLIREPFASVPGEFLKLQVLTRTGNDWQVRDLPSGGELNICRALDPIAEVLLIVTNARRPTALPDLQHPPNLYSITVEPGCGALGGDWIGEAHSTLVFGTGDETFTRTSEATDLVFEALDECQFGQVECFELVSGTVTQTVSGYGGPDCTTDAAGTAEIPQGNVRLNIFPNTYTFVGGYFDFPVPGTLTCESGTADVIYQSLQWLTYAQFPWPDPNVIEGTLGPDESGSGSSWRFVRIN